MEKEKVKEVCDSYNELLKNVEPVRENDVPGSDRHLKWMVHEIYLFLEEDKLGKAFRWLGFIQGALWIKETFSIEEMKNHNKPDDKQS